jgi:glyoxylase-like metal-dependent hydrolase (beta-lactamase superfamily II)
MKLSDRIYLVGSGNMGFSMTDAYDCHVYLIDGQDELAIIDAGAGMGVPEIVDNIRADGFEPSRVRHLILSHAHGDHAGGAAKMRAALDSPQVYLHTDCANFLREGDEAAISLADAKRVGLYPNDYHFEPCPVDEELHEGQTITVGDLSLQTIETPGHSQGHVSFLMEHNGQRIFFGADLVFFGGKILLQNTWDCDLRAQLASLLKMRDANIDVFLPGHLSFALRNGQRHIDAAVKIVDGLLVPANIVYSWTG